MNEHQRAALLEEGRRLEREEQAKRQRLANVSERIGQLIMTELAYTPLDDWPPVAKAALKHLLLHETPSAFEFKTEHARLNPSLAKIAG